MNGKPILERDKAFVRKHYRNMHVDAIAAKLGRSRQSVYLIASKIGLTVSTTWATDDQIEDAIREWYPKGHSDREIADAMAASLGVRVNRHRVGVIRRRMGLLETNALSEHRRQQVSKKTREQLAKAGEPSLAQLRLTKWKQFKADLGWPDHLSIRAVQALEYFYHYQMLTRLGLCNLMGVESKKRTAPISNGPGGTVLAELQHYGFISRLAKGKRLPSGKYVDLYVLNAGVAPSGTRKHPIAQQDQRESGSRPDGSSSVPSVVENGNAKQHRLRGSCRDRKKAS